MLDSLKPFLIANPALLKILGPVVVALVVYALGRWGKILDRLPRMFLPCVAVAIGVFIELGVRHLGWTPADVTAIQAAVSGAIGYGLAGAGSWSLVAPIRKADVTLPPPTAPAV